MAPQDFTSNGLRNRGKKRKYNSIHQMDRNRNDKNDVIAFRVQMKK